MKKYVKFTGKFRDLVPDGWVFTKLFADNYRQYHKTFDGKKFGQGCSIWQHHGGYFEIDDFFSDTYIIVEKVASGQISEWISQVDNCPANGKKYAVCWTIYDKQEKTFYPYHSAEYQNLINLRFDKYREIKEGKRTKEEFREWSRKHDERYSERHFELPIFTIIQDLLSRGWIQVAEDKRK